MAAHGGCMSQATETPANPKTSYIAVLSAIATLAKLTEPVWVGTCGWINPNSCKICH